MNRQRQRGVAGTQFAKGLQEARGIAMSVLFDSRHIDSDPLISVGIDERILLFEAPFGIGCEAEYGFDEANGHSCRQYIGLTQTLTHVTDCLFEGDHETRVIDHASQAGLRWEMLP